jgi:hypothetical protein
LEHHFVAPRAALARAITLDWLWLHLGPYLKFTQLFA